MGVPVAHAQEYIISTVAGPGNPGLRTFAGDGGAASAAQLNDPFGVCVDAKGTIFIADTSNNRIRTVYRGVINTFAGGGTGALGDGGPATRAALRQPRAIVLDSLGDLYIADTGNGRVRKVSAGIITTIAGGGTEASGDGIPATSARLKPAGIAIDSEINIFVSDEENRVRRISPEGIMTTVAGIDSMRPYVFSGDGGPAKQANLNAPASVAVDSTGNVFIADAGNNRIRRVSRDGIITTVTITSDRPGGLTVDSAGNVFFNEHTAIRKLTPDGKATTLIQGGSNEYSSDGGLADAANLVTTGSLAFDRAGDLYIADGEHNAVRVLRPAAGIDFKPGHWEVTEHIAAPLRPEQIEAFREMLANADKYPAGQRAAYLAAIKTAQENARSQAAKGVVSQRGVCISSDYPLKSLLFEGQSAGVCTMQTKSSAQSLSIESNCASGERKSKQSFSVERIDRGRLKVATDFTQSDETGKALVVMNRSFTGTWSRDSCAAGAP